MPKARKLADLRYISDSELGHVAKLEIPAGKPPEFWIGAATFVVCSAYLCMFSSYLGNSVVNGDEGIALQGAQRILQGQVLYGDFFSFYTPGSYYWNAALFKLFGSSFLVARRALAAEGGALCVLTYQLSRRFAPQWGAIFASYALAVAGLPTAFRALHNWDSTFFVALGTYFGTRFIERPSAIWSSALGLCVGVAFLFDQSRGVGLILGIAAAVLVFTFSRPRTLLTARYAAALAAGASAPLSITLTYFGAHHALSATLTDWVWPIFHYPAANQYAFGYSFSGIARQPIFSNRALSTAIAAYIFAPFFIVSALAVLVFAVFAFGAALSIRGSFEPVKWRALAFISAIASGLVVSTMVTGRREFFHLNFISPLLYVIFAFLLVGYDLHSRAANTLRNLFTFMLAFSLTSFGITALWQPVTAHDELFTQRGAVRMFQMDAGLAMASGVFEIGEPALVYPHEPMYYFLTGTHSAIRFDFLQHGMNTPAEFQQAAADLAANPPRLVLFQSAFRQKAETIWSSTPGAQFPSQDPVEDYLKSKYTRCPGFTLQDYWQSVLMARNLTDCPSAVGGALRGGGR